MTRVKICGLTRYEDAALAVDLGADALGFIFWPKSPRAVSPAVVREIGRALPAFVTRVGVFVDATQDEVASTVDAAELDAVQLHGNEAVEAYEQVPARLIRSLSLVDDEAIAAALALPAHVTVLVDAADAVKRGGTGRLADWMRAAHVAARRPLILAGGITAENVEDAIRQVKPWGIDVSSGVEDAPGVKNAERLRRLFDAVTRVRGEAV